MTRAPLDPRPATDVRDAPVAAMHPRLHVIEARHQDTDDTFTIELLPRTAADRLDEAYRPGQFTMLYVFGVGEVPISVSGGTTPDQGGADPDAIVHTIRDVGSVTRALGALEVGATVGVRGPFGTCWPVDAAEGGDVVIVAGGIGLAPLRPAIRHLLAGRGRYRRITLLIGARTQDELLYRPELETWRARGDVDVHVSVDRATGDWQGDVGFVTESIPRASFDPQRTVAMTCGPEIMMRTAADALRERGIPEAGLWLSMERNMKCAIGHCGHCQMGPYFVCKDGPVFRYDRLAPLLAVSEV